ncbi:F-box protein-like protein [Tanacetum coccineum]
MNQLNNLLWQALTNNTTSFEDIHRDITQTHILPLLDGPSLSKASSVSSYLQSLCSDHNLWSHISKSTWPSVTDPRVDDVISTFPSRHRSFYNDSYPSLMIDPSSKKDTSSSRYNLNMSCDKLISAIDIRYQDEIIYSQVKVTDMCADNMSSGLKIQLHGISQTIDLTVDESVGADKATLLHLKESLTLNWILIDHALKRAGNFSSIKPVSVKQDWSTNETHVRYVTILPGRDLNEIVKCRIHVTLGVGKRGVGLHVKEVMLKLEDLDCKCLNGRDFLVVMQRAIMEENHVKRKVIVDDEERFKSYKVFKELKKGKKGWVEKKEKKGELTMNLALELGHGAPTLSLRSHLKPMPVLSSYVTSKGKLGNRQPESKQKDYQVITIRILKEDIASCLA